MRRLTTLARSIAGKFTLVTGAVKFQLASALTRPDDDQGHVLIHPIGHQLKRKRRRKRNASVSAPERDILNTMVKIMNEKPRLPYRDARGSSGSGAYEPFREGRPSRVS